MALVLKDRVKETSTTAGTGTITLAGAVAGFQSFSAVGNGNTTYYAIVDPTTGDWEVGIGTYTSSGTTLSRDTVLSSSNSGSLVSFTSNPKDVFVTYPSEKSVYEDASNVVNATSFGAITATSAALTTGTVSTAPASGTDIANKTYVDTLVSSGITYHTPVKYEVPDTTGNLNATYNQPGGPGVGVGATLTNAGTLVAFTPDGTVATAGDRIIVYNQTNQFENGIYTVTTVGSGSVAWVLTRATDADTYALKSPNGLGNGDAFFITSGATGAGETYVCNTAGVITFGTTAITFAQISDSTLYTAGTGLTLSGTQFSITNTAVTAATYGSASAVPVFAVNAQGQITGVTDTNIAINGSQVSGNISGSAGSVANALTLGTYLTGGTYNGSAAVTATVDATSANTASKVVARDSSGNFSAGTITATLNGTATSTASATNLSGGAANQIAYQSATNTTAFATAPSASNQVLNWNGSAFTWSAGTISGVPLGSNLNSLTAGTYLTGTAYNGSAAQTWAVDATSANTASKVVARDGSGNFSAGTITASLSGNATTTSQTNFSNLTIGSSQVLYAGNYNSYAPTLTGTGASGTWGINVTGSSGSTSGNSATTSQRAFSGDISTTGQGRFTGWYTGNAATGFAVEAGVSAGEGYIIPYNRDTNTYGALNIQTSGVGMRWSGSVISVDSGYLQSNTSLRAPIFYDSDNTAYYGNFAGTSNVNVVQFASGPTLSQSATTGSRNLQLQGAAGTDIGFVGLGSNGAFCFQLYGISSDYGFLASAWGSWDTRKTIGGALYLNNQSTYYYSTDTTYMYRVYGTGDIRSPIYYDNDNTSYYGDFAGTSRINTINADSLRSYTNLYLEGNYGYGVVGLYSSVRYQGVFAMGSAYVLPADGTTTGNLYGIAWSYPSAGGAAANLASHGMLILQNGVFQGAWGGGSLRTPGDVRGTLFYDWDNTGYYVDPASTSYLYSLQLSGSTYFRPNNWIELNSTYGLYWPSSYSAHLHANDLSTYTQIALRGSKNSYGGIYDYYSGVNLGMYDSAGNGGVYREANGRWFFYYHVGNNCMGIGTSSTNSAYNIYCPTGVYSGGRVDGTIFYDAANTGYYLDLNGSSNASTNLYGSWYFTSNFNTGSGSSAPLQAYSSGGSGAVMSFHRGGYYAVNFGLDSDNVMRIGGWSASANLFQMDMSGNLTMAGSVTAYSDETLKKDWADMPSDFVPRLARVKSGTYTRIDNKMRQIGVGAQSLRPLMEEAVFENADGTLSVAYGNAAMASSVELARYVTALEQRISQLEARI